MLRQLRSTSADANPNLREIARTDDEDNLAWGARAVTALRAGGNEDWTHIVLLGGGDTMAFRLRVAQSHLRSDMLPSFWSESLIVRLSGPNLARAKALHVPLLQPEGGPYATRTNGVVERPLRHFADPARWPNIAVLALPVPQARVLEKIQAFRKARGTLDALEHILRWLAFAWGAARTPNPLHDGIGLPSACMIETACSACGLDLTPGLESRASCPEAIWVAVKRWHGYFQEFAQAQPVGCYWAPHRYPIETD